MTSTEADPGEYVVWSEHSLVLLPSKAAQAHSSRQTTGIVVKNKQICTEGLPQRTASLDFSPFIVMQVDCFCVSVVFGEDTWVYPSLTS